MPHFLFRSRWVASVWVAGVLLAISHFFGGDSALDGLTAKIRARKVAVEQPVESAPVVVPAPPSRVIVKRVDDPEELERYRRMAEEDESVRIVREDDARGDLPEDSYLMVDKSAVVEEATADDLRADAAR